MSAASAADLAALGRVRADAGATLIFRADGERTRIADLAERGGVRVKFPDGGLGAEAVLINTGGGLLGGDRMTIRARCDAGAHATLTTQSAERVYRSLGPRTDIDVSLTVASGGSLAWLPQETILFNDARLARRVTADVALDGSLTVVEAMIFGRAARGEVVRSGSITDQWHIRRDGRLIYAEAVTLDGDIQAHLDRSAIGAGARAAATLIHVAPDAVDRRAAVRARLDTTTARAAVSAWNGVLTARFLSADASTLRRDLVHAVEAVTRQSCPRVWNVRGSA